MKFALLLSIVSQPIVEGSKESDSKWLREKERENLCRFSKTPGYFVNGTYQIGFAPRIDQRPPLVHDPRQIRMQQPRECISVLLLQGEAQSSVHLE
jgi:hypothetical protein